MHGDVQAFYDALAARGVSSDDLLVLEGRLDRELVLGLLASVQSRVSAWDRGDLFLYYSGHGAYAPLDATDAATAEPALVFGPDDLDDPSRWVFWREVFGDACASGRQCAWLCCRTADTRTCWPAGCRRGTALVMQALACASVTLTSSKLKWCKRS